MVCLHRMTKTIIKLQKKKKPVINKYKSITILNPGDSKKKIIKCEQILMKLKQRKQYKQSLQKLIFEKINKSDISVD